MGQQIAEFRQAEAKYPEMNIFVCKSLGGNELEIG